MWLTVAFITIHVYAAIREDILGRQSIISTMISGYRFFREPKVSPKGEKGLF
jgi:Ni/Fe-hydrogenase 1 B-type cytochrome subunit